MMTVSMTLAQETMHACYVLITSMRDSHGAMSDCVCTCRVRSGVVHMGFCSGGRVTSEGNFIWIKLLCTSLALLSYNGDGDDLGNGQVCRWKIMGL